MAVTLVSTTANGTRVVSQLPKAEVVEDSAT